MLLLRGPSRGADHWRGRRAGRPGLEQHYVRTSGLLRLGMGPSHPGDPVKGTRAGPRPSRPAMIVWWSAWELLSWRQAPHGEDRISLVSREDGGGAW